MYKHAKLFAIVAASAVFSLFLGCGSSPHTYTLSTLTPSSVVAGTGDFTLTVDGANFTTKSTVVFAGTTLVPSYYSATQLRVKVPASAITKAGIVDVAVSGSTTSKTLPFTINNPLPVITAISQQSILLNSASLSLDITGSNFVSTSTVKLGEQSLTPTSVTPTQMTVVVPDSMLTTAEAFPITVVNPSPGGGASSALTFTVLNPVPVITALSLDNTLVDSADFTLTLTGSGFVAGMRVSFGSTPLLPSALTATQASVLVPRTAVATGAILDVTASNGGPGGGTSNALKFTVNNPLPSLTSLSVMKTLVDSAELTLDIVGTGFVPGVTINFGPAVLTPTSVSPTQISILVPKELLAKSGIHSVTASNVTPGGGASNALEFTVENPVPTLTSISLDNITAGSADFVLTLTGTHFVASSSVVFNNATLTPSASSSTELQVTIPASALVDGGTYPVLVTNQGPGGGPSNALSFTVNNPAPTLTALSQQNVLLGSPAFTLELTGTGFVHQSAVLFGSVPLIPTSYTATTLSVLVPETAFTKAGRLDVSVVNPEPGGGTSNGMRFTVENPVPEVTTVSPTSITTNTTDTTITLVGKGFAEDATVTLGTEPITTLSTTSTGITVSIPSSLLANPGTLTFNVSNPEPGGGVSNTVTITVHGKAPTNWRTVANNRMNVPNATQLFNSYNQPSVNRRGMVVFKGQGKSSTGESGTVDTGGGDTGTTVGIYVRDMSGGGAKPLTAVASKGMEVPQPNNTSYNGALSTFIQFPSFPRIDLNSDTIAVRGQSQPVWTYTLPDGSETRIGSAGVYSNPSGPLITGASLIGTAPGYEYFQVPGAPAGTRFDQFPGSPALDGGSTVLFKGNYTVGDAGKTGVYFRDMVGGNGQSPVQLIANSETIIPGQPEGGTTVFGSTAPPSASDGTVVFVGLDNEDAPTMGGIYAAPIAPSPALETIVTIGSQVPGEAEGITFNRFGEGLSFDGRYASFWGAWGTEMRIRLLICGVDGNKEMLASCRDMYPNGYEAQIPVHQGIFVYDMVTKKLIAITKTDSGEFSDFVYWVFSGRPPNTGGGSGGTGVSEGGVGEDVVPEPPRWRSSSFITVTGRSVEAFEVAFKAMTGTVDGVYLAEGAYVADVPELKPIQTVIDTTFPGPSIDPEAPAGSTVATVGMERDGLRSDLLVVTSSMLDPITTESNAGVYITQVMPQ
ncbi:MAG: hypothetical protein KGM96_11435 [Acidobacteriota bacterium]|nr:hypothetical protein [Acidobacteriota bacterium]